MYEYEPIIGSTLFLEVVETVAAEVMAGVVDVLTATVIVKVRTITGTVAADIIVVVDTAHVLLARPVTMTNVTDPLGVNMIDSGGGTTIIQVRLIANQFDIGNS